MICVASLVRIPVKILMLELILNAVNIWLDKTHVAERKLISKLNANLSAIIFSRSSGNFPEISEWSFRLTKSKNVSNVIESTTNN